MNIDAADASRLDTLQAYRLMDSAPEPHFDAIVRAAADQAAAPMAMISLVDDKRQWFKARVGTRDTEGPLSDSICAQAIQSEGLFVVPDAAADLRFRDMPAVRDRGIRFYAGAPLTVEGATLGMLCVIDTEARPSLTTEEARTLEMLARRTVTAFQLRRELLAAGEHPGAPQVLIDEAAVLLERAGVLLEQAGATAALAHLETVIALAEASREN